MEVNFLLPGKIVRVLIVLLFAFSAAVETERCEQRHCNSIYEMADRKSVV